MKNKNNLKKYLLFIAVLLLALALSACGAKPNEDINNVQSINVLKNTETAVASTPVPQTNQPQTENPDDNTNINLPNNNQQAGASNEPSPGVNSPSIQNTQLTIHNINLPSSSPAATNTSGPLLGATSTKAPKATPSVYKLGSRGQEVKKLQQRLKELKYYKGSVDGVFGKTTEAALKAFQARNGLQADGQAGRATISKIYSRTAKVAQIVTNKPKVTVPPQAGKDVYLRLGDTGVLVRNLQKRLKELGYYAGTVDGKFEEGTKNAVYAFQERNVAYADGVAGPLTLKALYSNNAKRATKPAVTPTPSYKPGSLYKGLKNSADVRRMQQRLKNLGYYSGPIDGSFGAATEAAVMDFQKVNGLYMDGVAGASTLTTLYSSSAKRNNKTAPGITKGPLSTPIKNYTTVTNPPPNQYASLKPGMSGDPVIKLQNALKAKGYYTGVVDGKYGETTYNAVLSFQKKYGLSQDGLAGPATQRVLYEGAFPQGS